MIVRDEGSTLLLITQPDHARLAADIIATFRHPPDLLGPDRHTILLATREHDNGWEEVDAAPSVNPQTGRPYQFTEGSASVKLPIWQRGIARVARVSPYAGALVAQHALTVHGDRTDDPAWQPFFTTVRSAQDALLGDSRQSAATRNEADLDRHYRCVQLGDALSLHVCMGWAHPQVILGWTAVWHASILTVSPDPFDGALVPIRVPARRIPARPYESDRDLWETLSKAPLETLRGEARGPHVAPRA